MENITSNTGRCASRPHTIGAVDLFCGAGGLTYGLQAAGIPVLLGVDNDEHCSYAYKRNCKTEFRLADIQKVSADEISAAFKDAKIRVLAGCAPCQPFSTLANARKSEDGRWELLKHFGTLVRQVRPEIVSLENVPQLAKRPVWFEFMEELERSGYHVSTGILSSEDFGVAQSRKRLVLLASKLGEISLPEKIEKRITVRDCIGSLPSLDQGQKSKNDPLHKSARLSELNQTRIRASSPGGTWRDWPKSLRADCHNRSSGKTYPAVYGRMEWDEPSPTITTQFYAFGSGRFGHPEQNRALTLREGAMLQSFPKNYQFFDPRYVPSFKRTGVLIGNAVPPELARHIGKAIVMHIEKFRPTVL